MGLGKIVGATVLGLTVAAGAGAAVVKATAPEPVVVTRIVDGDTIEVRQGRKDITIRLLNVDTPESKHPYMPPQCLSDEATRFLERRLPAGTRVDLEYDQERLDPYGRTLAGVFESGSLVNAEIAAAGLGAAVVFEPNHRFYRRVLAAQDSARVRGLGLFADDVDCTIPSRGKQVLESAPLPAEVTPGTSQEAASMAGEAVVMLGVLGRADDELRTLLKDPVLTAAHVGPHWNPLERLEARRRSFDSLHQKLQSEEKRLLDAEEQVRREAEQARVAREARIAEEARIARERRKADEAARQPQAPKPRPTTSTSTKKTTGTPPSTKNPPSTKKESAPSNPYPGYTGPRCYAPGGKTWRPC